MRARFVSGPRKPRRKMHVKKGDIVVVISGADKSMTPREVLSVDFERGKVTLKEVNMKWKHLRRSQQSPQGGRIRKEFPIDASKVLLWSEKAQKGVRTRVDVADGKKIRVGIPCKTRFS